jgi:hypothetical protein
MRYDALAVQSHDADFIAHAREDIPYLLTALKSAEAREQEAKAIGWDEALAEALITIRRRKGTYEAAIDLVCIVNPYRSAPTEQEK